MKPRLLLLACYIAFACFACNNNKNTESPITNKANKTINAAFEQITISDATPIDSLKPIFKQLASLFTDKNLDKTVAQYWYQQFMQHYQQKNNELGQGYINLAIAKELCNHYDFETGLPYYLKSIDNFTKANDYQMLVKATNGMSLAYHDFSDYSKGIEFANRAIQIVNEHPNDVNKNTLWYSYNNLGINYDDDKQSQRAIDNHLQALPYGVNASDSSYSYNNLGNTHKKMNHLDSAAIYFRKALLLAKYDPDDVYHLASVYSNLLDIERLNKNLVQAVSLMDSAFFYAQKSESPEKLIDYYNYAYLLRNEMGDYQLASQYLNQYVILKDSLLNTEKAKIVYNYQIKYETEKKEKQIVKEQLISKQKNIWLIVLGAGILIGLVVFRNFRTKSKLKQQQLGLENQLLKEQSYSQMQAQRLEISRDLHDSIGAQLTFINSILGSLKRSSVKIDDTINTKINTLSEFSENSIAELKNTLWVLNTEEIKLEDLRAKILNFINHASEAKDDVRFNFNFDFGTNFQLNSKQAVNLFRAVQEIINNAMKYADASEIKVELKQKDDAIYLTIADNGKGFDYEKEKNKSYGLTNIHNRIAAINGTMNLETQIGKGTVYNIQISL